MGRIPRDCSIEGEIKFNLHVPCPFLNFIYILSLFQNSFIIKTYNVDRQTPDSAATATALFSGSKTNFYTLGYDSNIRLGSAKSAKNAKQLTSILDWGQSAGKRTGYNEKLIHLISYPLNV